MYLYTHVSVSLSSFRLLWCLVFIEIFSLCCNILFSSYRCLDTLSQHRHCLYLDLYRLRHLILTIRNFALPRLRPLQVVTLKGCCLSSNQPKYTFSVWKIFHNQKKVWNHKARWFLARGKYPCEQLRNIFCFCNLFI